MLIKIFGRGSLLEILCLCRQVEEAISQSREGTALSMAFLDLDHHAAQRQARLHHIESPGPVLVATTDEGAEVVRCEADINLPAFLHGLSLA